jgi:protein TonB
MPFIFSLAGTSEMNRKLTIAASVIVFHGVALWALQNGLLHRALELSVPAQVLVEIMAPVVTQARPPLPAPPKPSRFNPSAAPAPTPAPSPTAQPLAVADTLPAPSAAPLPLAPATAPAVAAPLRVQLPSTDADYLQNPKPNYPPLSKRLREQGSVVLRVFIDVEGHAQKAEIKQSSGFDRLDQAALNAVLRWRYVPGKRAGLPEAMGFNVPISFVLE